MVDGLLPSGPCTGPSPRSAGCSGLSLARVYRLVRACRCPDRLDFLIALSAFSARGFVDVFVSFVTLAALAAFCSGGFVDVFVSCATLAAAASFSDTTVLLSSLCSGLGPDGCVGFGVTGCPGPGFAGVGVGVVGTDAPG